MNTKNLPMKFALVAFLIAASIWGIFAKKLKLGIDLRGGHALIFEIVTNDTEKARLESSLASLEAQRQKATDPATRKDLDNQIGLARQNLKNLAGSTGREASDLPDQIIARLKERIDPRGFYNLEMRPLGKNRIEIRMPMGDKESRDASALYSQALERLEKNNLHPSELSRVADSAGTQRQAEIDALSGGDANRAMLLAEYAAATDEARRAREELNRINTELDRVASAPATAPATGAATTATAPAGPEAAPTELESKRDQALLARDAAQAKAAQIETQIFQANVNTATLGNILRNYVSPQEMTSGQADEKRLRQKLRQYELAVARLKENLPARAKDIDETVAAYENWMKARRRLDDPTDLIRLVRNAGVLEFRIAPETESRPGLDQPLITKEEAEAYKKILQDPAEGTDTLRRRNDKFLWFPVHEGEDLGRGMVTADARGRTWALLYNDPAWMMLQKRGPEGWNLTQASVGTDDRGQPDVRFEFNENGAKTFAGLTGAHLNQRMAVLLDDEVYSAPTIQSKISASGQITGNFTPQEADALAKTLKAGSLPAKLNPDPIAQSTFGPAFGESNLRAALRAGYWSAIFVMGFMLLFYMRAGLVADAALVMNLLLTVGAMGAFDAVFTLPGIAGVILVIGMSVDANVLIYERLREEQAKGLSPRLALKNSYERAFSAIFDSNLTTIISAAILGWIGTEEIKGFAITLGLGVAFNMFTAVYLTRWIFQALLDAGWMNKPVRMLPTIRVPNINWMGLRHYFWVFSAAVMALGVVAMIWQGRNFLGIEFTGGTRAVVALKEGALIDGKLPDDGLVRDLFTAKAQADGYEKLYATSRVEKIITNRVSQFMEDEDKNKDGRVTLKEWTENGRSPDYFRLLAQRAGATDSLSRADLEKYLPAKSFQIEATETRVPLFQQVAKEAFGDALAERQSIDFDLAKGLPAADSALKLELADDGLTRVTRDLADRAEPRLRSLLQDADNGVLMAVRVKTPSTQADIRDRIRDVEFQPDFSSLAVNRVEIFPLKPAPIEEGADKYLSFAVIVAPGDPAAVANASAWNLLAQSEFKLVEEAIHRKEAMVVVNFDPAVAAQAKQLAVVAMVLAWIAMIVYLWVRFGQFRWGLAAVLCLVHDVTITAGMVAVSGWLHTTSIGQWLGIDSFKMDLTMVAALLTIIGYSVNDTIVIFDRIRENRGRLVVVTPQIINLSVNQTLSRTLLTNLTVMVVVFIMYIFGGQGIHAFSYAMVVGAIVGTYSTIAIASPMLLGLKEMMVTHAVADLAK
jgi:SecD/SecF fusion protein